MSEPSAHPSGAVRVTVRLEEATAIQNPERFTKGDWVFRIFTGDVERWQSPGEVHIGRGETKAVGGEFVVEVPGGSDHIDLYVEAAEKDILSGDDLASGETMLYRSLGFGSAEPAFMDVKGPDAHLRLKFTGRVEPA